jgi:hypothetical protein
VFTLIAAFVRREPLLMAPYVVYSLLTFLLTSYLVPASTLETVETALQLPYLLLAFLMLGDFLARGATLTLLAMQFSEPLLLTWRRWWLRYSFLSLGFCLVYMGASFVVMHAKTYLSVLGLMGVLVAMVAVLSSVVLILFAPLLMFFRGLDVVSSFVATFQLMRRRFGFVFRVGLMNLSLVFLFVFLGAALSPIPIFGMTLSYLFQAFGQMAALIYTFIAIGQVEWRADFYNGSKLT